MQRLLKKVYLILLLLIMSIGIVLIIQYKESRNLIENKIQAVTEVSMKTTVYEINEWINDQLKVIDEAVYFITFDEWNESVVLDYFIEELHRNKNFKSIYYVTPDNEMINGSGWIPPEGFDLRKRIWYQRAIESDETVITDAFLILSGEADIITIAKSVVNQSGELLGVVGGDILLSRIQDIIEKNYDDAYGVTFLINRDGQILNADKINVSEDQFDKIVDETKTKIFSNSNINHFSVVMSNIQDKIGYLVFMPIENSNWFLVNYASAEMIVLNNSGIVKEFLIIFTLFIAVFVFIVIEIKKNIASPLLVIENEMKKIDFEKDPTYRISLNENIGFEKLVNSVNYLLENIENYIEVIKIDQKKNQSLNEELKNMLKQTKTAEKTLARQKIDLEVLFNDPNDAVVRVDKNDCVVDVNETFTILFGYTLGEIYGEKLDKTVCDKDTLEDAQNITGMVSRGEAVTREGLRYDKNNKPVYVLISGIPIIFENKVVGGYTIYKDISDRIRVEKEVITQKMIFEALFKNSADSILRFDNNNKIIDINDSFTILFGYELDEVIGKDVDEIVASDSVIDDARTNSEYVKGGNSL
ncbi:MAG: PAS domain S-box protein, partial [Bacillota bacterium]|nr:PAS domain S-box protein [Bacillota bacterium]